MESLQEVKNLFLSSFALILSLIQEKKEALLKATSQMMKCILP